MTSKDAHQVSARTSVESEQALWIGNSANAKFLAITGGNCVTGKQELYITCAFLVTLQLFQNKNVYIN